jgi:lipoprotein
MKISKFIYAAVVGGVLASCQSVDTPMFSDKDAFVAFDSKSTSIAENAGSEVKIPVSLVASKGLDVSVGFEIDTTAYAGKNAAKEGVNYRLKNTSNTLSFAADGEMVAYISIEPIDNGDYNGDVCFDIKLSAPEGCNLGANYTTTVTISDDDHPLAAAGILGTYTASGVSPFQEDNGATFTWTCEVVKDADYVDRVWFTQIVPTVSGATYKSVMGTVSADFKSITINAGQDLGTYGSTYTLSLDFNGASSATAYVSNNTIAINTFVLASAASGGETVGYLTGVRTLTLTKVEE